MSEHEIPTKKPKVEGENESPIQVTPPPLDAQILIDKTASWVCKHNMKNGDDLAVQEKLKLLKDSNKERFEFLFPESKFHNYYRFKLALYTEMLATVPNGEHKNMGSEQDSPHHNTDRDTDQKSDTVAKNEPSKGQKAKKFPTLKGFFNT